MMTHTFFLGESRSTFNSSRAILRSIVEGETPKYAAASILLNRLANLYLTEAGVAEARTIAGAKAVVDQISPEGTKSCV